MNLSIHENIASTISGSTTSYSNSHFNHFLLNSRRNLMHVFPEDKKVINLIISALSVYNRLQTFNPDLNTFSLRNDIWEIKSMTLAKRWQQVKTVMNAENEIK